MNHRRALLAATAAIAFLLTACTSAEAEGPVALRMTVWTSNEDHLALFEEIADDFIEENPDRVSSVTFETVPFEDYTTALTTQIAGGNPPDLAWVFESSAAEFIASDALLDLTPTLDRTAGYDLDDIEETTLGLWERDGSLYGYPFSNSPFVMFVNTDRVDDSGQPDPHALVDSGDWTFDAVASIAAGTVDALGGSGLVVRDFDYTTWSNLAPLWAGWGAEPWSADGTRCGFADPAMVDALGWFHEQVFTEGTIPGPGSSADFFAGDTTFTITQISRASSADGSFDWDVLPLPAGPAGQQNIVGQGGVGVLSSSDNTAAAADFLAFFTNPENSERLSAYFPPPRTSLLTPDALSAANPMLDAQQLGVVVDSIRGAEAKRTHANYAQLDASVRSALDALWTADADPGQALTGVCESIDPLLGG